ncbi:MAG: hypothetical protein LBS31_09505, partial [Candidatus Adiutrix sp.]|nr:hypothetical protein [Candidatus Adiutrix sp.]
MRILVAFKAVADLESLAEEDWTAPGLQIDERYVKTVINQQDESALELALRLGDRLGPDRSGLWALTIGDGRADPLAAYLLALRFGRVFRLPAEADL